jgi:hypothetical protein
VQERTLKVFRSFETLPFIDDVYGENLRLRKGTFWLSLRLLPLSSPEEKLWFSALARVKRLRPLRFILLLKGKERAGAPKVLKNWGQIMGFYTQKYRLAFKQDPLRKNQVG